MAPKRHSKGVGAEKLRMSWREHLLSCAVEHGQVAFGPRGVEMAEMRPC